MFSGHQYREQTDKQSNFNTEIWLQILKDKKALQFVWDIYCMLRAGQDPGSIALHYMDEYWDLDMMTRDQMKPREDQGD